MRFRDRLGHALGLQHNTYILTIGTQDANNSRHELVSQLIKLPPVAYSDEVPTGARAFGSLSGCSTRS